MDICPLPADEDVVRRYVTELWIPYHHELEQVVESHAFADEVDVIAQEVEFCLANLESESYRAWIAVDDCSKLESNTTTDSPGNRPDLGGFVTTDIVESPVVFDRPNRLIVNDLYVSDEYRGTGLAGDLINRAIERSRSAGCEELVLNVDVDNERAIAFYEKCGFETYRHRMTLSVDVA